MSRARDLANVADDVSTGTVVTTASPSLGRRNLVINGAMQVAQRGTSFSGLGAGTSYQLDRWQFNEAGASDARFTVTQDSDAPNGFSSSYKVDVTTADTGITGAEAQRIRTRLEGQDLQQLAFGTSDAKSITFSFWVKSNKTGQYSAMVYNQHADTDRKNYKGYTIDSADTWEYKTITYEGDTDSTAAFTNDNTSGLIVWWNLSAGDTYIGSTTGWHSGTPEAVTGQVNLCDTVSNYWQITGVQLEVGSVATPFEHRSFQDEYLACMRYYETSLDHGVTWGTHNLNNSAISCGIHSNSLGASSFARLGSGILFKVKKRTNPTVTLRAPGSGDSGKGTKGNGGTNVDNLGIGQVSTGGCGVYTGNGGTTTTDYNTIFIGYDADAEL